MSGERFFFVLGMPRARTAWLSVALSYGGAVCFHEALADCADLNVYEVKLRNAGAGPVGDSDAALAFHFPEILSRFPGARTVVVRRDPAEAERSLQAAEPERAGEIAAWWGRYMEAFERAAALVPPEWHFDQGQLSDPAVLREIGERLTGKEPPPGHMERLLDLRITTCRESVAVVPEQPKPIAVPHEFLTERGIDASGLSLRWVTPQDMDLVTQWWRARNDIPLAVSALPPLGVMVEKKGTPLGALWCYESFGVGVASLEWPVTTPGLGLRDARRVMGLAVAGCIFLAGKRCDPPGEYRRFQIATLPPIARFLKTLGFVAERDPRTAMTLILN